MSMFRKKLSAKDIMRAAKEGDDAEIRKQLAKLSEKDAKALVNEADENKETALHIAAESGHLNFVNLLIQYGADVNAVGIFKETPLHRAAAKNYAEIAKSLLNAGAKLSMSRLDSEKPIHVAASKDALAVLTVFIEHDPSQVNLISKESHTPLFYAAKNETKNLLIHAGAKESINNKEFKK
jgi:ankyrin repeat protein